MGTFEVEIEIGDPRGERFESVDALVDTGATYTVLPRTLLERLGVQPHDSRPFRLGDDRVIQQEIGRTWVRLDGKSEMTLVVFGQGNVSVLGAYALEGFGLAADPFNKRLVPVEGLMMMLVEVPLSQQLNMTFTINGRRYFDTAPPNRTLLEVVRDDLRLTGAKEGCGTGDCGACSMIVNGKLVTSCLMLAPQADGAEITTIEGLAQNGNLHPVQQAFIDHGAVQCGFCIPGMILAGKTLLDRNAHPTRDDIRAAIAGNLCRCTGYTRIVDAIEAASQG